ncbi:type II toxin-antitoxin system CcdA family antitoxin [Caulobacter sp.]|uniref:type II toxin-antitoxin system CcdA family antitoxin n=1 Tax=Caulobacter sp. TaxID=78 RepID=UPI003BB21B3C
MGKVELDIGIDPELLAQAKRLGISVTGMSETQLRLHLQKIDPAGAEDRARRWAEENAEVIGELNGFVEEHGAFGAEWRRW